MTAPTPSTTPPALRAAGATAFAGSAVGIGHGILLLVVVSMTDNGSDAWSPANEDFSTVVAVGLGTTTLIAILLAIGAGTTMRLGSRTGRILLFIAAGTAIPWNLGCGLILSIAWTATSASADSAEPYQSWQFTTSIVLAFAAGAAAVVTVVLLAQKPVGRHYRALNTTGHRTGQ